MDEDERQSSHNCLDQNTLLIRNLLALGESDDRQDKNHDPHDQEQNDSNMDHGLLFDQGWVGRGCSPDYAQNESDGRRRLNNFEHAELEEYAPHLGHEGVITVEC